MTRVRRAASRAVLIGACVLCVRPTPAMAQDSDPHAAQPERPTVSTHAGTITPGWLEVEAGVENDDYDGDSRGDLGPVAIKIGLARRLQLTIQDSVIRAPGAQTTGIGDVNIGVKWRLIEDAPILGDFAILPAIKFPLGSVADGDGTGTTDASLLVISSHEFGPVALDVNVGVTRRSGDGSVVPRTSGVWAAAAGAPLYKAWGWTSEIFGYPATSGPAGSPRIIGVIEGVTFRARKWLILDAGVALPASGPQPHAAFAGVTYNVCRMWGRT